MNKQRKKRVKKQKAHAARQKQNKSHNQKIKDAKKKVDDIIAPLSENVNNQMNHLAELGAKAEKMGIKGLSEYTDKMSGLFKNALSTGNSDDLSDKVFKTIEEIHASKNN